MSTAPSAKGRSSASARRTSIHGSGRVASSAKASVCEWMSVAMIRSSNPRRLASAASASGRSPPPVATSRIVTGSHGTRRMMSRVFRSTDLRPPSHRFTARRSRRLFASSSGSTSGWSISSGRRNLLKGLPPRGVAPPQPRYPPSPVTPPSRGPFHPGRSPAPARWSGLHRFRGQSGRVS